MKADGTSHFLTSSLNRLILFQSVKVSNTLIGFKVHRKDQSDASPAVKGLEAVLVVAAVG